MTDKYTYDAYGSVLSHESCATGSIDQPYQYVGQLGYYTHYQEPDFGLLQLGVRFYDTEAGRFTQRDWLSIASESSYTYCQSHPTVMIDPEGMTPSGYDMCAAKWDPCKPGKLFSCVRCEEKYEKKCRKMPGKKAEACLAVVNFCSTEYCTNRQDDGTAFVICMKVGLHLIKEGKIRKSPKAQ